MANYYEAYDDGHADGVKEGFKSGAAEGYAKGYEEGYAAGGGGASSEWKYKTKTVIGYGGTQASNFDANTSVLYAPNAEGTPYTGQFREMAFGGRDIVLDFPKMRSITPRCFSGMLCNSGQSPCLVSSGNFPEVHAIGERAFADNRTVTADFPKCTRVDIGAFHMHDENDGQQHSVSGNLSFAAVTPLWACFPAMSGTISDKPYHVGPMKVPIIPVRIEDLAVSCGDLLPSSATREIDGPSGWHWGPPGSGSYEMSVDITWSGASVGAYFFLEKADADSVDDSGAQNGVFGNVVYKAEDYEAYGWTPEVHESKFNISLPGIPVEAVANTKAFQDAYAASELPRPGGVPAHGTSMHIFGLAYGSTITCSDGVYTVE